MRAPCGHRGECIIGNYIKCLEGCDKPKPPVATRITQPIRTGWVADAEYIAAAAAMPVGPHDLVLDIEHNTRFSWDSWTHDSGVVVLFWVTHTEFPSTTDLCMTLQTYYSVKNPLVDVYFYTGTPLVLCIAMRRP